MSTPEPSVVVIGATAAGLATATVFAGRGWHATVLEAGTDAPTDVAPERLWARCAMACLGYGRYHIRFGVHTHAVEAVPGRWYVRTDRGTHTADRVVVARWPEVGAKGLEPLTSSL